MDQKPLASKEFQEFHLKEFDALRKEISDAETRFVTIIQYVLLLSAVMYSFLLGVGNYREAVSKLPNLAFGVVASIPTVVSIVGAAVNWATIEYMINIGKYLEKIEATYGLSELGWERHSKMSESYTLQIAKFIGIIIVLLNAAAWFFLFLSRAHTAMATDAD
jgi:hypothetical protein